MSIANLLVPNNYNTESNSHQLNIVGANPIVSTHDLWANNAFVPPHIFWGAVDLQAVTPSVTTNNTLFFPSYTSIFADNIAANNWLMQKDANGTVVMQLTGLAAPANLFADPVARHSINVGTGYELTSFDIVYCNITAMTSATVTLNSIQYTNNVANAIVNVPITGAINIAASATNVTPWVTNFTINTPFFLAQDQTLDLKIAITSPVGNVTNIYGIFAYFTNIA